ncbi:hypothetical protein PMAYCL1PPCAC_16600, partial [Pristionchus mayeri]
MRNSTSLRYGFDVDREWLLEMTTNNFESYSLLRHNSVLIHPCMLFLLLRKSSYMDRAIRIGYMLIEIGLVFYDWILVFSIRFYILSPLPALFCEGILCRIGLPKYAIM